MIREDNITLQSLQEDLNRDRVTLKEYVTKSEGSALFTVALNKQLLNTYENFPVWYKRAFKVIQNDGKDVRFPSIFGIRPEYVPELSEVPFGNLDVSSTTVYARKFGLRMGISQEMIDDNEVGLLSWIMDMIGQKTAMLFDQECAKVMDAQNATGMAADGTWSGGYVGSRNRGVFYATSSFTNGISASAANWEQLINTAVNTLQGQTKTLGSQNYRYPVNADTIIAHSVRDMSLRKVLNSSIIIGATGIGDAGNASITQVAGKNMFNQLLNVVTTPYLSRSSCYITKAGRGLILLMRKSPAVDQNANWAFDAKEARVLTRFWPAVIDELSVFSAFLGTA